MDVLKVKLVPPLYFSVSAPCGMWWQGMRDSDDVAILMKRAMAHPAECPDCAKLREAAQ